MQVSVDDETVEVETSERLSFGRGDGPDLSVAAPDELLVSRVAGELAFEGLWWSVTNVGRRSFFVVEAGVEVELLPDSGARSQHALIHDESWLRIPTSADDVAVVLDIPDRERPPSIALQFEGSDGARTVLESAVTLTANELLSVLAVYEGFLRLPPAYRREPNSYRAAAHRLGVEEGKVKADLRRVQGKVARAGGPDEGGSRVRDALIGWLASRRVVTRAHLDLLDQV